jgi:hypothetical protein
MKSEMICENISGEMKKKRRKELIGVKTHMLTSVCFSDLTMFVVPQMLVTRCLTNFSDKTSLSVTIKKFLLLESLHHTQYALVSFKINFLNFTHF